jgi:hypothetical protein
VSLFGPKTRIRLDGVPNLEADVYRSTRKSDQCEPTAACEIRTVDWVGATKPVTVLHMTARFNTQLL